MFKTLSTLRHDWELWYRHYSLFRRFQDIQGHATIFSHVHAYWWTLRHIEAYWEIIEAYEPYSDISKTLCSPCIYIRAIFKTLACLEPDANSKACRKCMMIRHIQSFGIVKTVDLSIFKGIYGKKLPYSERCATLENHAIFRTLPYSELWHI